MSQPVRAYAAGVLLPGFAGTTLPDWLRVRLQNGLAGVCLFGENIAGEEGLAALTASVRAANPAAVIAIDEEGGDVTRLSARTGSPYPGNAVLGRLDDIGLTAGVARAVAVRLAAAGVNLNLAPVADVNSNALNPVIGVRSFGADAGLVARHAAAWTAAHERVGVATSVKHFPGHGDVAADSHLDLPVLDIPEQLLRSRDLLPFGAAIAAGARTVMTSHILLPRIDGSGPATFSAPILGGLLRGELGFTGVIVTDALDMAGASAEIGIPAAAVRALAAGADLLCLGTRNTDEQLDSIEEAIVGALESGLSASRLADAAARVAALGADLGRPSPAGTLADPRTLADPPALADPRALPDVSRIAAAFDVQPGAVPPPAARLVQIGTAMNIAVGDVPWGLWAAGVPVETLRAGDALPPGPLVLVGKDNHRHAWVRDLIDRARAAGPTLVIDMGWPSPDRTYADVATFGASRAVGEALARWLATQRPGETE